MRALLDRKFSARAVEGALDLAPSFGNVKYPRGLNDEHTLSEERPHGQQLLGASIQYSKIMMFLIFSASSMPHRGVLPQPGGGARRSALST